MSIARLDAPATPPGRSQALYSPEVLALAASLGVNRLDERHPLRAQARSRTCGSLVDVSMDLDDDGRISAVGVRVSACAVGQAAAAVFADGAPGREPENIRRARAVLAVWLTGNGEPPEWRGMDALSPAIRFPGRHSAILLPWDAAIAAFDEAERAGSDEQPAA